MDNKAIGRRIREARLAQRLTQEQLAERAGISSNYVSIMERGIRSATLDIFVPLCNALGVSSDYLLQDVVDSAVLAQTNELSEMLRGQPADMQRIVIRAAKAIMSDDH